MLEETHPLRVTARLKLSAGVKPDTLIENLTRLGYPRELSTQAVHLELAHRKNAPDKTFQLRETRKSFLDSLFDNSKMALLGLAIAAVGALLFFGTLFTTHYGVRPFLSIFILGLFITLIGILTAGND